MATKKQAKKQKKNKKKEKTKKQKVLTVQEAKDKGYYVCRFLNGDYAYRDEKGIEHLIREGQEIASGSYVFSYDNGDYRYEDERGESYLIKNDRN